MRFGAIRASDRPGGALLGLLVDDELRIPEGGRTLLDLLRDDGDAIDAFADDALSDPALRVPIAEASLASPLPNPPTVRDFMTFEGHTIGGMGRGDASAVAPAWWEIPTFYFTNPYAICGPQDDVPLAPGTERFDYEVEVAAIIGRAGHNLTLEEARSHIAGYSLFVDWSARDIQMHEMTIGLGPAKGKDTVSTLGPWFVTADEIDALTDSARVDLPLTVSVNGVRTGAGNLREMAWEFAALVSYASRGTWVMPGDVLGSGTCDDGCLAERWGRQGPDSAPPLAVGDVVEIDGGLLGRATHRIVASAPRHPLPGARPGAHERSTHHV
ncbi:fumarylacetoacetate hydrolase family protein [Microbacterium soli]|uniref:Fumarylacetoacetate hydrolase family protein n=1 Tax=Microbacterium soli TaxID=446075 RepID=A0ABP7MXX1_9MICO